MSAHSEEDPELIEAAPTVLVAGPDAAGQRLDQWLAASLGPDMSRSRVQMLIRQGAVSINGKPVDETKRKMAVGESASTSASRCWLDIPPAGIACAPIWQAASKAVQKPRNGPNEKANKMRSACPTRAPA